MKQFAKLILAMYFGNVLFYATSRIGESILERIHSKEVPQDPPKEAQRGTYSPQVSGRRTIGFKMSGEE